MDTRLWLIATCVLTACLWVPYVLDRFVRLGILQTLGTLSASDLEAQSAWARRARSAHANAIENLALFAPLAILALRAEGPAAALASAASAAYFFARVAHFAFQAAATPALRTVAFLVGFGAQLTLAFVAFGVAS